MNSAIKFHANEINADTIDGLMEKRMERGYAFITLDQALEDKA